MHIRIRKKLLAISVVLFSLSFLLAALGGSSPPGTGTINSIGTISDPNGKLKQVQLGAPFQPYNATDNASTHTITFNVLGAEFKQPASGVVFNVTTTGSLTLKFIGSAPQVICAHCTPSYSGVTETITYAGGMTDVLTVIWNSVTGILAEPGGQTQMFLDNFLYSNPEAMTQWTIDQYATGQSGIYTKGGYLTFVGKSTNEAIHVNSPLAFSTSYGYSDNTLVKRKLTVALIPFTATVASATADVRIGLMPLYQSGSFPGSAPYNTPVFDNGCGQGSQGIGGDFMLIQNNGQVSNVSCGDGGSSNVGFVSVPDLSLYSVITVETRAVTCSACADKMITGSAWAYFRFYQEDSTGKIINDKTINVTGTPVAPLVNNLYVSIAATNNNGGATSQTTKINLVQLQNYGSPVCLGCVPPTFPTLSNCSGPILCALAVLASWIGGGDLSFGWAIVSIGIVGLTVGVTVMATRNLIPTSTVGMLTIGAFYYGGVVPTWIIFLLLLTFGCFLGWGILKRLLSGAWSGQSGGAPVEEPVE